MDTTAFFSKAINYAIVGLTVLSLGSCHNNQTDSSTSNTLPAQKQAYPAKLDGSMCFQKVDGSQSKDTLTVSLTIK